MSNRQSQKSGHSSVNIQGQEVSIGLGYSEVRQVAMDLFEANFHKLRNEAAEIARERAESFVNSFIEEAAREGQTELPEAENPDFQYVFFSSQREYARTGDENLGDLLVQLLVDRTKVQQRDLEQIVLNESLAVASKLTLDQLDALSLIFSLRYTIREGLSTLDDLHEYLDEVILPFVLGASRNQSAYQHLEFAGCGAISVGEVQAHTRFSQSYSGLLCEGFSEEEIQAVELTREARSQLVIPCLHNNTLFQINAINEQQIENICEEFSIEPEKVEKLKQLHGQKMMRPDEIRNYLIGVRPQMANFFELWEGTPIKNMTLTSVGIAIAHANVKRQTGETSDLSIWI